jgi:hypothetical protein
MPDNDLRSRSTDSRARPLYRRALLGLTALSLLLLPMLSFGQSVGVAGQGFNYGTLNVTTYTNGTNPNVTASLTIIANYAASGDAGAAANLNAMFTPNGLTYLQTVTFNVGAQQQIFRRNDPGNVGANLVGTFIDAPVNGYRLRNNTNDPNTFGNSAPWYPFATLPPNNAGAGGQNTSDNPNIPFGANSGIPGLTGLLNNAANGNVTFETALVGVLAPLPANSITGNYGVCVLKDFVWGFNFTNNGVNSYNTTLIPLTFADNASGAFMGAFNRGGVNDGASFNVTFTPEPGGMALLFSTGLVTLGGCGWRRRRRAVRRKAA